MALANGASIVVRYDLTDTGGAAMAPESLAAIVNRAAMRVEGEVQAEPDPGSGLPVVAATSIEQLPPQRKVSLVG
jgi:hypothetical protein